MVWTVAAIAAATKTEPCQVAASMGTLTILEFSSPFEILP